MPNLTHIKIEPGKWIMFGGQVVILPNWFVRRALEENYIKPKEGSTNGEMEFVLSVLKSKE